MMSKKYLAEATRIKIIIAFLLLSGSMLFLVSCKNRSNSAGKQVTSETDTTKPKFQPLDKNPYEGLRHLAFSVTPEQLSLKLSEDKIEVYGVVMDWGMEDITATTVAYKTGDASLYLSSGGTVIGGGKHRTVKRAAKQFVRVAQTFLNEATKTDTTSAPIKGQACFYLLTNKGMYVGKASLQDLEDNSSAWRPLFHEGNKVIRELRLLSQ